MIRSVLHFANNELDTGDDRLFKIRPILDLVQDTYPQYFEPGKKLSLDETFRKFLGRIFFKQYMPKKPCKWGIKIFSLCDADTGYLLKFHIYTGKSEELPDSTNSEDSGMTSNMVKSLTSDYMDKGHVVYMDNFYSGIPLFEDLRSKNTGACGTICNSRKHLPKEFKKINTKKR